jgi:hypothetical protein
MANAPYVSIVPNRLPRVRRRWQIAREKSWGTTREKSAYGTRSLVYSLSDSRAFARSFVLSFVRPYVSFVHSHAHIAPVHGRLKFFVIFIGGKIRNAVHLEGGLNRKDTSPHENANCISPLPPLCNYSRPWTLFYGDWMSLKTRRVLTGRI